jgi:hypothetical protein
MNMTTQQGMRLSDKLQRRIATFAARMGVDAAQVAAQVRAAVAALPATGRTGTLRVMVLGSDLRVNLTAEIEYLPSQAVAL